MTSALSRLLVVPVRFYQRHISPGLPARCRYAPTCSQYAVEALQVHGALKGLTLAAWRLLRCNPWSAGGVDHVPPPGRWQADPWVPPDDWAGLDDSADVPRPMGMDPCPADTEPARGRGAPGTDVLPARAGRPEGAQGAPEH